MNLSRRWGTWTVLWVLAVCLAGAGRALAAGSQPDAFTRSWSVEEPTVFYRMVVGDLDGEGPSDVVVGATDSFWVYLARDGGLFDWSQVAYPSTLWDVALADADGDGDQDLAGATLGRNAVWRNDGGAFTMVWQTTGTSSTYGVKWGDVDRDGDPDVVFVNSLSPTRVFRNDGNFAFQQIWASPQSHDGSSADFGDVDGDGDLDLLLGAWGTNVLYLNDGTGVFAEGWSSQAGDSTWDARLGDYDADGDPDMLVANQNAPSVLLRNDGGLVFTEVWTTGQSEALYNARWVDVDGDGDLDMVFSGTSGAPTRVYGNQGGDAFGLLWDDPEALRSAGMAVGDADGDGDTDLYSSTAEGMLLVFTNTLDPVNEPPPAPSPGVVSGSQTGPVTFTWTQPFPDDHTPGALLTHHVRLGTTPGGGEITGGGLPFGGDDNADHQTSLTLTLEAGTYYWTVFTADGAGLWSDPAPEQSFTLADIAKLCLVPPGGPDDCSGPTASELMMPGQTAAVKVVLDLPGGVSVDAVDVAFQAEKLLYQGCTPAAGAPLSLSAEVTYGPQDMVRATFTGAAVSTGGPLLTCSFETPAVPEFSQLQWTAQLPGPPPAVRLSGTPLALNVKKMAYAAEILEQPEVCLQRGTSGFPSSCNVSAVKINPGSSLTVATGISLPPQGFLTGFSLAWTYPEGFATPQCATIPTPGVLPTGPVVVDAQAQTVSASFTGLLQTSALVVQCTFSDVPGPSEGMIRWSQAQTHLLAAQDDEVYFMATPALGVTVFPPPPERTHLCLRNTAEGGPPDCPRDVSLSFPLAPPEDGLILEILAVPGVQDLAAWTAALSYPEGVEWLFCEVKDFDFDLTHQQNDPQNHVLSLGVSYFQGSTPQPSAMLDCWFQFSGELEGVFHWLSPSQTVTNGNLQQEPAVWIDWSAAPPVDPVLCWRDVQEAATCPATPGAVTAAGPSKTLWLVADHTQTVGAGEVMVAVSQSPALGLPINCTGFTDMTQDPDTLHWQGRTSGLPGPGNPHACTFVPTPQALEGQQGLAWAQGAVVLSGGQPVTAVFQPLTVTVTGAPLPGTRVCLQAPGAAGECPPSTPFMEPPAGGTVAFGVVVDPGVNAVEGLTVALDTGGLPPVTCQAAPGGFSLVPGSLMTGAGFVRASFQGAATEPVPVLTCFAGPMGQGASGEVAVVLAQTHVLDGRGWKDPSLMVTSLTFAAGPPLPAFSSVPLSPGWRMMGLGEGVLSLGDGGPAPVVLRYDTAANEYMVMDPFATPPQPGMGYWVVTAEPSGVALTLPAAASGSVALQPGWNLVAPPLTPEGGMLLDDVLVQPTGAAAVSLSQALSQQLVRAFFRFGGGGYHTGMTEPLAPLEAFWLYVDASLTVRWQVGAAPRLRGR